MYYQIIRSFIGGFVTSAYVISFPKSGRTWLRMLIADYYAKVYELNLTPSFYQLWRQNYRVPIIQFTHMGSSEEDFLEFNFNYKKMLKKKVVCLIRDPRDVIVSYYFHKTRRERRLRDLTIQDFIQNEIYGISRIIGFMNLIAEIINQYDNLKVISYESIHKNPEAILKSVLEFLGEYQINNSDINKAVCDCSFTNMRGMEMGVELNHFSMKLRNFDDPQSYKVREGKVGGYVNYLSDEDIDKLNVYIKKNLNEMYRY